MKGEGKEGRKGKKESRAKRRKKGKTRKEVELPGRFELPSTDSESVVIAATLREQGIPHRQIR